MSRIFDWIFGHNSPQNDSRFSFGSEDFAHEDPYDFLQNEFNQHFMQDMFNNHMKIFDIFISPMHEDFQDMGKNHQRQSLRDKLLRRPQPPYGKSPNSIFSTPNSIYNTPNFDNNQDVDLDDAIRGDPHLLDRYLSEPSQAQVDNRLIRQHQIPFEGEKNSNFNFSYEMVVISRDPNGKVRQERKRIRQDGNGNQEIETSSTEDTDNKYMPNMRLPFSGVNPERLTPRPRNSQTYTHNEITPKTVTPNSTLWDAISDLFN